MRIKSGHSSSEKTPRKSSLIAYWTNVIAALSHSFRHDWHFPSLTSNNTSILHQDAPLPNPKVFRHCSLFQNQPALPSCRPIADKNCTTSWATTISNSTPISHHCCYNLDSMIHNHRTYTSLRPVAAPCWRQGGHKTTLTWGKNNLYIIYLKFYDFSTLTKTIKSNQIWTP